MKTTTRNGFLVALLVAASLAGGCGSKSEPRKVGGGSVPATARIISPDPRSGPGATGVVGELAYCPALGSYVVKANSGNNDWELFPSGITVDGGSGGGVNVAAGTGIFVSVDAGVATVTNAAPFGSPISLSQNNSVDASVTTMTYTNTFATKTAGAETTGNVFGARLDGGTINTDISFLNEQAPQLVTTSIAQPSIAWPPRTDVLDVTVGATTLTKLTVTGLDMDADRLIAVEFVTVSTGEAASITTQSFIRFNNETNGVVGDFSFQRAATTPSMAATAAWVFTDSVDTGASSLNMSRGEFSKSPGGLVRGMIWGSFLQGGNRFEEHTTGVGDSTTDVTSIVIVPSSGNLAGTGDHYKFYRGRAFAH